jgi:hypothetical protein
LVLVEISKEKIFMFDPIMEQILAIARDAWAFMAGLLIVVALPAVCISFWLQPACSVAAA